MRTGTWRRGVFVLMAGGLPLLAAAPSAGGQQARWQERQQMRQQVDTACQQSLEAFCAEERGPGRIRCLMENYEETSAACQAVLDEARKRHEQEHERREQALAEACGEDAESLCSGEDGPELFRCLMENYEETSAACQSLLDEIQARGRPGPRGGE